MGSRVDGECEGEERQRSWGLEQRVPHGEIAFPHSDCRILTAACELLTPNFYLIYTEFQYFEK